MVGGGGGRGRRKIGLLKGGGRGRRLRRWWCWWGICVSLKKVSLKKDREEIQRKHSFCHSFRPFQGRELEGSLRGYRWPDLSNRMSRLIEGSKPQLWNRGERLQDES